MRTATVLLLGVTTLTLAGDATAGSMEKGASILAVQLTQGVGDIGVLFQDGYVRPASRSELGAQVQFWNFRKDDYAFSVSAGIGYYKEVSSQPGKESLQEVRNSWQLRVGGDRFGMAGERLEVFGGPGVQIWGGKAEFEGGTKTPSTLRYALDGRIGIHLKLNESFGIVGQLGRYWGFARAEQAGSEAKWLPSGSNGALGFGFGF